MGRETSLPVSRALSNQLRASFLKVTGPAPSRPPWAGRSRGVRRGGQVLGGPGPRMSLPPRARAPARQLGVPVLGPQQRRGHDDRGGGAEGAAHLCPPGPGVRGGVPVGVALRPWLALGDGRPDAVRFQRAQPRTCPAARVAPADAGDRARPCRVHRPPAPPRPRQKPAGLLVPLQSKSGQSVIPSRSFPS